MKISSLCFALLVLATSAPTFAAEAAASPFDQRTVRLFEIAVHRYVPGPAVGEITEKRYLLDARSALTRVEVTTVPVGVTIPESAFDKVLIHGAAWTAYRQLGPQAFANFELVSEVPFEIAGRLQYEVRAIDDAKLDIGKLVNLSTRGRASRAEKLIVGFVITEHSRTVLVRAVGPTLAGLGVTNVLADPYLTIYKGALAERYNDNWGERFDAEATAEAARIVGAFPLPPGSKDAAMVVELEPGVYSVHVEPASSEESGNAMAEIYVLP